MLWSLALLACASCSTDAAPTDPTLSFDTIDAGEAREMLPSGPFEEGRIAPNGETTFRPVSADLEQGVPYRSALGTAGSTRRWMSTAASGMSSMESSRPASRSTWKATQR